MGRWHRLTHPDHADPVWTDTPAAYAGWVETATASRPPGDHEDKVGGKWIADEAKRATADRRAKLKSMHRDQLVDHIVELVIERLKAAGLPV